MIIAEALTGWIPMIGPASWLQPVWWLLLIPMAWGLSMVYKAIRVVSFEGYWTAVLVMTLQIVIAMVAIGLGLMILIQFVLPMLPVE
ncbi:MAG: hypothetical protein CMJ32_12175 [Phycisphaerae bacterium]|nr:hypothetical protein [Phycisphaerae bacterium]